MLLVPLETATLRSDELQGVVGNILVLENFGAAFPSIYMNASIKVCAFYISAHDPL